MAKLTELEQLSNYVDELDEYFFDLMETAKDLDVPEQPEFTAKELGSLLTADFEYQLAEGAKTDGGEELRNSDMLPAVEAAKIGYALIKDQN